MKYKILITVVLLLVFKSTNIVSQNYPVINCCISCTDVDNDGFCVDVDCDDNDATVGTQQIQGTVCDDNNANTENDVILSDGCTCAGTIIPLACTDETISTFTTTTGATIPEGIISDATIRGGTSTDGVLITSDRCLTQLDGINLGIGIINACLGCPSPYVPPANCITDVANPANLTFSGIGTTLIKNLELLNFDNNGTTPTEQLINISPPADAMVTSTGAFQTVTDGNGKIIAVHASVNGGSSGFLVWNNGASIITMQGFDNSNAAIATINSIEICK